jgi:HD superfamily phosphodiesterase
MSVTRYRVPDGVRLPAHPLGELVDADDYDALGAEVERLTHQLKGQIRSKLAILNRVPDPNDLRLVLDAAEYVVKEYDTGPEPDMLAAAIASLCATLEEA